MRLGNVGHALGERGAPVGRGLGAAQRERKVRKARDPPGSVGEQRLRQLPPRLFAEAVPRGGKGAKRGEGGEGTRRERVPSRAFLVPEGSIFPFGVPTRKLKPFGKSETQA